MRTEQAVLPVWRWRERLQSERGLSRRSATTYAQTIHQAERAFGAEGYTLRTVPASAVMAFAATTPESWASRKLVRSALSHAFVLVGRKNPPIAGMRVPPKPRMRCRALDERDANRLAAAAHATARSLAAAGSRAWTGRRQSLAVLLALYMGLRREEIAKLAFDDFSFDGRQWWLRIFGKGGVQADLPVREELVELVMAGRFGDAHWVFQGLKGTHVAAATVWHWVRRFSWTVLELRVTPHTLRHTCLATANDNTGNLRAVQDFARHARPDTTAGYTRTSTSRLIEVMNSISYDEPPTLDEFWREFRLQEEEQPRLRLIRNEEH